MAILAEGSIAGAGPLSALARSQYRALAAMRWHAFRNGMRSKLGAFELGARTLSFVLYALLGLGLSAGLAASTYMIVSNREWRFLPLPLWALFLL
jgi:ABC-2 type transport system permease protein